MGTTSSKAVVDNIVNSYITTLNETTMEAASSQTCANIISQVARGNCVINNTGIVQTCSTFTNLVSLQTAVQDSIAKQDMKTTVDNAAATIDQNFSLKVNATKSTAFTSSLTNLFTNINNSITSMSATNQISVNDIDQECYDHSAINNISINQSALQKSYIKAAQDTKQVIDAKNALDQVIKNHAKTTVQNAIGQILMMIALIIGLVVGAPMLMTAGAARSVSRYAMVLLIMWVYIWFACSDLATKWLSFIPNWCKDDKKKKTGYIIATIISVVLVGLTVKDLTAKSNNQPQ